MVVAAGGALEQHLPDRLGSSGARAGAGPVRPARGRAALTEACSARSLGDRLEVNCYHHQGVAAYPTFEVAAISDDDVIEAVEAPGPSFYLGVQWHPETGSDGRLFEALVGAAR